MRCISARTLLLVMLTKVVAWPPLPAFASFSLALLAASFSMMQAEALSVGEGGDFALPFLSPRSFPTSTELLNVRMAPAPILNVKAVLDGENKRVRKTLFGPQCRFAWRSQNDKLKGTCARQRGKLRTLQGSASKVPTDLICLTASWCLFVAAALLLYAECLDCIEDYNTDDEDDGMLAGPSSGSTAPTSPWRRARKKRALRQRRDVTPRFLYPVEQECIVCMHSAPDLRFSPCGHGCICTTCFECLDANADDDVSCPLCREHIARVTLLDEAPSAPAQAV